MGGGINEQSAHQLLFGSQLDGGRGRGGHGGDGGDGGAVETATFSAGVFWITSRSREHSKRHVGGAQG